MSKNAFSVQEIDQTPKNNPFLSVYMKDGDASGQKGELFIFWLFSPFMYTHYISTSYAPNCAFSSIYLFPHVLAVSIPNPTIVHL